MSGMRPSTTGCYLNTENWCPGISADKLLNSHFFKSGNADFDDTVAGKAEKVPLKAFKAHLGDWKDGDPTWKDGKGKGHSGAINYLSDKGCNAFSFLPYKAGGDGDNVWPFVQHRVKRHYDCSKLDQWGVVFDHGTAKGMYLHFKLQENEIVDNRVGHELKDGVVAEALDGGLPGIQRRLYRRELIARFGHALALNWNLGEENTQSADEQRDMSRFLQRIDPYDHLVVVHTFPDAQDKVYPQLLGDTSSLTGASLQNSWSNAHQKTLKWVTESAVAGRPWVVCNDEQNPASLGVPHDPGYQGHDGIAIVKKNKATNGKSTSVANSEPGADETRGYTMHDVRTQCLWGTVMAVGVGVEYYFGYQLPQNDLICEDFRSRDKSWDYCRIAINFFRDQRIPLERLAPSDKPNNSSIIKGLSSMRHTVVTHYWESGQATEHPRELNRSTRTGTIISTAVLNCCRQGSLCILGRIWPGTVQSCGGPMALTPERKW